MIRNDLSIEDLSSDFIKENMYEFHIEVFDGPLGKPSPMLEIHVFFDRDELGEEIGLSVDWYKGHFIFEPYYTSVIRNGEKYESYDDKNEFLHNLVGNIKNWVANNKCFDGLYCSENQFEEYGREEIPKLCDYRKKYDIEYLYVVSIGVKNSIARTKLYKKQLFPEGLLGFLSIAFYGVNDFCDDGIFYKVFIQNKIMILKDYDDVFLKPIKKLDLQYECYSDEEEIRSVYSSAGDGIRCPECNGLIKYSANKKQYKCILCGKRFFKKFLSEKYNTDIYYEKFPKIFKGN